MFAFKSNVHGLLDLETGHTWTYGQINWLTEDQMSYPQVKDAIESRWLIQVTGAEVRQAMTDPAKKVGPKPAMNNVSVSAGVIATAHSDKVINDLRAEVQALRELIYRDHTEVMQFLISGVNEIKDMVNSMAPNAKTSIVADELSITTPDVPVESLEKITKAIKKNK